MTLESIESMGGTTLKIPWFVEKQKSVGICISGSRSEPVTSAVSDWGSSHVTIWDAGQLLVCTMGIPFLYLVSVEFLLELEFFAPPMKFLLKPCLYTSWLPNYCALSRLYLAHCIPIAVPTCYQPLGCIHT